MLSGLNADQQDSISIVSFDLCNRHFSYRSAAFYGAELSFSSDDYCSLVTWQMPGTPQIRSLVTRFSKMAVFSSSDLSKLFGVPLVFLSKSPFKLNLEIKGS